MLWAQAVEMSVKGTRDVWNRGQGVDAFVSQVLLCVTYETQYLWDRRDGGVICVRNVYLFISVTPVHNSIALKPLLHIFV